MSLEDDIYMKYVGTFYSIDTVLYKITQLKTQGYAEQDVVAISNVEDNISILQGQTEIGLQDATGGKWHEKFEPFSGGKDQIVDTLSNMGLSEQQARTYYNEMHGGGIALFVKEPPRNHSEVHVKMDSSAELGSSGELLDNQDEQQQILHNDNTVPRIQTENL